MLHLGTPLDPTTRALNFPEEVPLAQRRDYVGQGTANPPMDTRFLAEPTDPQNS